MNEIMKNIIGHFSGVTKGLAPSTVKCRHHQRMIMLVRWTFLNYCERHHVGELPLGLFGHGLESADIGMWMGEPYMQLYDEKGEGKILFQYSTETLKSLYKFIKKLN